MTWWHVFSWCEAMVWAAFCMWVDPTFGRRFWVTVVAGLIFSLVGFAEGVVRQKHYPRTAWITPAQPSTATGEA